MATENSEQLAEQLRAATHAGDLAAAYAVLKPLDIETVKDVAMQGGYSLIFTNKKKRLLEFVQAQMAEATRLRGDGWLLKKNRAGSARIGA